jgi:DNA-binding SARP family transcriptional activator
LYLRTFGGLGIEAEAGEGPAPSLGPRRLALLAVVAASGPRGITRERILGILWPEKDEEQARHTLSQTLYLLRRDTGSAWITGGAQLRLDASIRSDVVEFNAALGGDRLEHAAALYRGPFLDGFYLTGAPQFEEWVEQTRARFQVAVVRALETLGGRALEAGSFQEAAAWWQHLTELDPFNATYAVGRVRALVAAGDRAGALRFAREYESRIRRELDAEPDDVLLKLIAELREKSAATARPGVEPPLADLSATAEVEEPAAARIASGALGEPSETPGAEGPAAARHAPRPPVEQPERLPALDGAPDPGAYPPTHSDGIAGRAFPRHWRWVAATAVIVVLSGLGLWRLVLLAPEIGAGPPTRADRLSESRDTPAGGTHSPAAEALYEQGLRAYFAGNHRAAAQLMRAALARDSMFAMAAVYAWRTSVDMSLPDEAARDLEVVRSLASSAPERERLLIRALIARYGGAPLTDVMASARQLAQRYPQDPEGQVLLGLALYAAGAWQPAVEAFDRAVAIDSIAGSTGGHQCRICDAIAGARDAYLWSDSAAAAERTARRLIALRPRDAAGWWLLVEPLLRLGRRSEAEAANATAARLAGGGPVDYFSLNRDLIRTGRLEELEGRILGEVRTASPEQAGELPWLLALALRNQGRLRDARALADSGIVPGTSRRLPRYHEPLTLAIAAVEAGEPREAGRLFLDLVNDDRARGQAPGFKARSLSWHMTLAATALAERGDTATVRALADSVERIGRQSSFGRDYRLHHFLHGLLLQRQNRHADAVDAFRAALFSLTDGYTRINLELARSLVLLQRYAEAIAVLQPALRGGVDGANSYVTHTELHDALARAFEAASQPDSARAHFAAVERAWRSADPQFAQRYAYARARAATSW